MIEATVIFGTEAAQRYDETKEVPPDEWIEKNGGCVTEKTFATEAEYAAYVEALNESDGWYDSRVINRQTIEKEDATDNLDCDQVILNEASKTSLVPNPTPFQFRYTDQPHWTGFPKICTVENYTIDFPSAFLRNYHSSDYVAWEDDMQKFLDDEITLEEFRKYGHDIETREAAEAEMMRLRKIILEQALSDFFNDLTSGKLELRSI